MHWRRDNNGRIVNYNDRSCSMKWRMVCIASIISLEKIEFRRIHFEVKDWFVLGAERIRHIICA